MRNESGFTLIEIIVSLVLVGMMAAIAGMGIVTGTKGYLLAKENSHMAQKAQLAMARIQRELMELTGIGQAGPAFIIYDNTSGRHAIAMDNTDTTIKMYNLIAGATILPAPAEGDILVDNVHNFTLDYFQGSSDWNFGNDINLLSAIQADLELGRSDGSGDAVTFSTTVNPRNTKNYGGAPPAATPNTAHNYSCFVATAAYGDFDPPIMLLFSLLIIAVVLLFLLPLNRKAGKLEGLEAWKLKNLSASWPLSLLASQPLCFPTSKPPSLPASLLGQNKGNVLIGLIVTMMIFAALGAGMVAMTGTSTSSQVTANTTSKAYYLAESGFRYAASEYLNAADNLPPSGEIEDDRNRVLITLHDSTEFRLSNPDERFDLQIFSYYFITTSFHNSGPSATTLNTDFAGGRPEDFSMPAGGGRLKIGSGIYDYSLYNEATGVFTLTNPLLEPIDNNMNVNPVGNPSGIATMTDGGDLTLTNASFFPAITGKFMIDGIAYTYKTKDEDANTLQNITDANVPERDFSLTVDTNTNVILKPYLKVHSTGIVGQDGDDEAASRKIVYNVPIPDSPTEGEKVEFHDRFNTSSSGDNWNTISGTHEIDTFVAGALKVTGTDPGSGESLIGLNRSETDKKINLEYAHRVSGYFLSYDAQVKVGFDGPDNDYAAGLSFRLDQNNQNNNSYGVSFMKAESGGAVDTGIIPEDSNGSIYDIPMIVLWQQIVTGPTMTRKWLAYTFGVEEIFNVTESALLPPGWTAEGTWARVEPAAPPPSGTWCWTDSPGNYIDGTDLSLITPSVDLSDVPSAVLTFWHKYDFEFNDDYGHVEISTNNWVSFNSLHVPYTGSSDWEKVVIDISAYLNPNVQIRFRADATGISPITDVGWYIDDVTIHRGFPVNDSTLLVRIKEGATVEFENGATAVEDGDTLTQDNGAQGVAQGVVVGEPILESGDWAGSAQGIIILNKLSGPAFQGGTLYVAGKGAVATFTEYNSRDNYIKVFYGDTVVNEGNSNPFDDIKKDNTRNEAYLNWPPDDLVEGLWPPGPDGDATYDYFTLVKWHEFVDPLVVPSVEVSSKYEPGVIIRSHQIELFTPDSSPLLTARPELGLHTFGHGSTNVYFDDFGLLVEIAAGSGLLTPIQE